MNPATNAQHPDADDALLADAERHFRAAVALCPQDPDALHLLATAAHGAGLHTVANELLDAALRLAPHHAHAWHERGRIARDEGRYANALHAFSHARDALPADASLHADLADVLRRLGRLEEAEQHASRAIALAPTDPGGHVALAHALYPRGDYTQATAALQQALALDPHHPAAHRSLAHLHFLHGRFAEGYPHYEHRWQLPGFRGTQERLARPCWTGDPLGGRTLLLHAEQGLGDTIQMLRYILLIPKERGRIVLQVQPALKTLLRNFPHVDTLLARGEQLPAFDCHAPLLSLPQLFNTSLATIPASTPYLHADPLPRAPDGHLHVGLAWSGNPLHPGDYFRSIPFPLLAPLFTLPQVSFHRLHTRAPGEAPVRLPTLTDPTPTFHDLADTAAYIASLDLVISVDTAIAHLTGALGKPVWTLLPFAPDWRWLLDRADTPWYPTMRLFRQPCLDDWPAVITTIRDDLAALPFPA